MTNENNVRIIATAIFILGMQVMCAGQMVKDGLNNVAGRIDYVGTQIQNKSLR